MSRLVRGPFGVAFRHCLRTVLPWGLATAAAAAVAAAAWPADLAADSDAAARAAAASPWLVLPMVVLAGGCCLVSVHLWPTFARQRPGAELVRRLCGRPSHGRGAALAGALLAQLVMMLPLTIAGCWWLDAPPRARRLTTAHATLAAGDAPILRTAGDRLTFRLPTDTRTDELWLQPDAALPDGSAPTRVLARLDGADLAATASRHRDPHRLVRLPVLDAPRELRTFELLHDGGNVQLYFGEGSVVAVGPAELATAANAALLALLTLSTSAASLLLAFAIGAGAHLGTTMAAVATLQFVQWIGAIGPMQAAVLAVLRGQWLW